MKIERLRLHGLTRFEQPVDLDFSAVPPGLIAVVGPNGAGKTSILEAMFAAWYGEMPSRSDRELVDLVGGRKDAYLDATVTVDGRGTYRGRMNIDGLARKRDAVLQRLDATGAVALNDGKISTYTQAVATILPGRETVLASAFAAQNKQGSFSTLDRKGRKDLFAQLLGLEQLEGYAATARSAAQLVDRRREALQAQVDVLRPMTRDEEADALGDEGNRLQVALGTLEIEGTRAQRAVTDAEQAVAAQRAREAESTAARQQQAAVRQQRADAAAVLTQAEHAEHLAAATYVHDRESILSRAREARARAEARLAALPSDEKLDAVLATALEQIDVQRQTRRADLEARIANNQGLLDRQADIAAAVAALTAVEAALATAEATHAERVQASAEFALRGTEARQAAQAEAHWAGDLQRARDAAQLLTTVPFGDRCAEAGCAFVAKAAAARDTIPALEISVQRATAAEQVAEEAGAAYLDAKSAETAALREVQRLRGEVATQAKAREWSARLNAATDRVTELRRDLEAVEAEATQQAARARADRETRGAEVDHERAVCQDALTDIEKDRVHDLAVLEARVATVRQEAEAARTAQLVVLRTLDDQLAALVPVLEQADAEAAELSRRESALARARADLANQQQAFARLSAEIDGFERRRAEFRTRHAERVAIEAAVQGLETELIEWQALARVFGRDGLPVLEIDAAGPNVSALANDLLQACFGGRFSVELVTQEAKAGGKGLKESFALQVWDAERGGDARDLSDLSGGEQVIIDEALKCALALFVNSRNVQPLRTCWRDETTGALDPENAIRYVAMLRRARERGGFVHTIFISHNPEAAALADVQLVVEDGTARFVYPPFDRTVAA